MNMIQVKAFKKLGFVLTVIASLFFGTGVYNSLDAAPKKGGILKISILNDIGGFDSLKVPINDRQRVFVMQAIHETLFDMDPNTFE
ncbi:MAG: hypothetical protein VX693_03380, partial [Pseudomonadota bacterium]|nr:hypothetical protein [Pseudomonadota bacterium]